ncbi:phe13-bombesin receptor-like [Mytilus californianus]|uniref:phe13-bombesin receptor-like n=1 Tax=Mytilus californianus TaxID=6549 RepID=UPI0022472301|nr:phe13-bombesin receptor-like [Mytilus californianus]
MYRLGQRLILRSVYFVFIWHPIEGTTQAGSEFENTQNMHDLGQTTVFTGENSSSTDNNMMSGNQTITTSHSEYEETEVDFLKGIYETLEFAQDMYVLPVVCTVGIIGNTLVATYLYKRRGTNSSFIYMFALLLSDTLSLVSDLFLPFATLLSMTNIDSIMKTAANIYFWNKNFITYILKGTAFNTLCVLSAERLIAIKYPLKLKSSLTVTKPYIFLFLSFVISVCTNIQIPLFTEIAGVTDSENNETSYKRVYTSLYLEDKPKHDSIVLFLHFFAGPVQIIFFCVMNVLIVHGIYQNRKSLLAMNMNNIDHLKSIKNLQVRLCKIFLALCFTNILAFLPNSVTTIIAKMFPELGMSVRSYSTQLLLHGGNLLRVLNSASDFIIMLAMSIEIRRDVKRRVMCLKSSSMYEEKENMSRTLSTTIGRTDVSVNGKSFIKKY